MNFYQSDVWKEINSNIYKKSIFEVDILGSKCFGITKSQRHMGKTFNRYMVHGIEGMDMKKKRKEFTQDIDRIKRDYGKSRGDLFFQFGFQDIVETQPVESIKSDEELGEKLQKDRSIRDKDLYDRYELLPSRREHMPDTTVILQSGQKETFSRSGKRYVNKGKKTGLTFHRADSALWEEFWEVRYAVSYDKGFYVIPLPQFLDLMRFLEQENAGTLLVSMKDGKIVSGSVVVGHKKRLIYLYGATDRRRGSVGAHYWLTQEILTRAEQEGYKEYDLLGVAPPWNEKGHYLGGVTRFKQSFGGKEVLSLGNYDLVINSLFYRGFQLWRNRKKVIKRPKKDELQKQEHAVKSLKKNKISKS